MKASHNSGRVFLLDECRGASVILMVVYHALYDLVFLFGVPLPLPWNALRALQPVVAGVFIFVAGVSSRYSRSNLRRGLIAAGFGVSVSLVLWIFLPEQMIWFGILHFMGASMLLFALLRPLLDKLAPLPGMLGSAVLFFFTRDVPQGKLGLPWLPGIALPETDNLWLAPFGFGGAGSDYFPLIPWFFLFLAGAYFGVYVKKGMAPAFFYRSHAPRLAGIGRRALLVYVLHQPLTYGLFWLIFEALQ